MARRDGKDRGLFERPKGSGVWWVRYHDQFGKEHREKVGSKSAAREVYQKRKTQVREETFFPEQIEGKRRRILLDQVIEDYLSEVKAEPARSFKDDERHAKLWLAEFAGWRLTDIQPTDVERWKRARMEKKAPATALRDLAWLKRVFNVAIRDGLIDRNPVAQVKMPKINNARVRYLTDLEEAALQAVMSPEHFELVELAFHTGMRRSEQFNLRWEFINFRVGVLTIPRSI